MRIIPARAGFTSARSHLFLLTWDHPRSRGVYDCRPTPHGDLSGSSPLARGLPVRVNGEGSTRGIIPARAGFTRRCVTLTGDFRDHPRSRGVYTPLIGRLYEDAGSSPLARGLLGRGVAQRERRGIIPARAGFTESRGEEGKVVWDHPRSRGVYELSLGGDDPRMGSSPLARGLLSPSPRRG